LIEKSLSRSSRHAFTAELKFLTEISWPPIANGGKSSSAKEDPSDLTPSKSKETGLEICWRSKLHQFNFVHVAAKNLETISSASSRCKHQSNSSPRYAGDGVHRSYAFLSISEVHQQRNMTRFNA
jgi:hypothetical protein